MRINARIRGRARHNDFRSTTFWVDELTLRVSEPEEAFELAAIKEALITETDMPKHPEFLALDAAIQKAAQVCRDRFTNESLERGGDGSFQKNEG